MKNSGRCPKCAHTDLFHSACVMDRGEGNAALCLAIGRKDVISAEELGQFTVYACRQCGFAEFYVSDPHRLVELIPDQG